MKKSIIGVFIIISLLMQMPMVLAQTRRLNDGEIFLNDTFEYQLTSSTPSGYTLARNGNGCSIENISDNKTILCVGKEDAAYNTMRLDKNFGENIYGSFIMECKINITSEEADIYAFMVKNSDGVWDDRTIRFNPDGKITFMGSEICQYQKDTTYRIVLFVDTERKKITGSINSYTLSETDFSFDNIKAFRFRLDFQKQYSSWIDDIRIYGGSQKLEVFPTPEYNKDYALLEGEEYAKIFERPSADKILDSLNVSRPRVLVTNSQISKLKSLYGSDNVLKKYVDDLMKTADEEIPKKVVRYSDAGARVVSQRIKNRMATLGMAYLYTKDEKYAVRMWQEAESFCGFADWFPEDHLSHAEFLYSSAFVYDWLYDWFQKEENIGKQKVVYDALINKGILRCEQVYDVAAYGFKSSWATMENNINAVCNSAVICACIALLEKEENNTTILKCLEFSIKAPERFLKGFAPDGGWHEGFSYASYGLRYFVQALSTLENACSTDFGLSKAPGFSDATDFYIYMTAPGGIFNFHDATWFYRRSASEMYYFANKFNKPYLGYYATKFWSESGADASFLDLAFYKGEYEDGFISPDRYFKGIETCAFSSGESYLGVHAGQVSVTHGEFDAGNFIFDALGERFVEDLGPDNTSLADYNTVRADFPYYRRRAEGHNTLVINSSSLAGQSISGETEITKYISSLDYGIAVLDLTSAYEDFCGKDIKRGFLFDKDAQSVIVRDEISLTQSSEIYSFFHTKADVKISDDEKSATLTRNGKIIKVVLISPSYAKLGVMDAEPLVDIPNTEMQSKNEGVSKLFVHLTDVLNEAVTLQFLPVNAKGVQEVKNISLWEVPAENEEVVFENNGNKIFAKLYADTISKNKNVCLIFAGYDKYGNLREIDVLKNKMENGINYMECAIESKDVSTYKLFLTFDENLKFKVFKEEVN